MGRSSSLAALGMLRALCHRPDGTAPSRSLRQERFTQALKRDLRYRSLRRNYMAVGGWQPIERQQFSSANEIYLDRVQRMSGYNYHSFGVHTPNVHALHAPCFGPFQNRCRLNSNVYQKVTALRRL